MSNSYRARDAARDGVRHAGWFPVAVAAAAVVMLFAIIVGAMGVFGFGWFQRGTADFRGETEAIENVQADGDFRIAAYQQFFDLCAEVQSVEDRIGQMENTLANAEPGSTRADEAQTNLDALRATRSQLVRDYNSLASRDFTEGQFRDRDLPYQLNINSEETQCAA